MLFEPLMAWGLLGLVGLSAVVPLQITERSFSADPEILSPGLQVTASDWKLTFDARFQNHCLAESGVMVLYLDLSNTKKSSQKGTRLVTIRQKPNPAGCPEIFRPVMRHFMVQMKLVKEIDQMVLMDSRQERTGENKELQVSRLDIKQGESVPREQVAANPLYDLPYFPIVSDVVISGTFLPDQQLLAYTTEFEVLFPTPCHASKGLEAEIIESRTGVSDEMGYPVLDWLFLINPGGAECSETLSAPITKRYSISREVSISYDRKLAVVNPTQQLGKGADMPFTLYKVWTSPPIT